MSHAVARVSYEPGKAGKISRREKGSMIDQGQARRRCRQIGGRSLDGLAAHIGCLHGRSKTSSDFQGVAAGDRYSGTGSVGFAVLFDKPARVQRHVSMRVPVRGGTHRMASVPGEQFKGRVTCLAPPTEHKMRH